MLDALLAARVSGWAAIVALVLALLATPSARIVSRIRAGNRFARRASGLRRRLGIASAALATAHAAIALGGYLDGAWLAVLTWPHLRAGLAALAILIVLLVTSFPIVVRALRVRLWKPLHRLSYAAGFMACLHVLTSPFAPRVAAIGIALVFALSLALRARIDTTARPRQGRAADLGGGDQSSTSYSSPSLMSTSAPKSPSVKSASVPILKSAGSSPGSSSAVTSAPPQATSAKLEAIAKIIMRRLNMAFLLSVIDRCVRAPVHRAAIRHEALPPQRDPKHHGAET